VAEILPKDRRGQILLMLTVAAVFTGYVLWKGFVLLGVVGITENRATRDTLQIQIDSIETLVRASNADVQSGTVQVLQERLVLYRANLDLMRQLVPSSTEMANLIDDITSRARSRGVTGAGMVPQPIESGSPFDTQKIQFTVIGLFDQVGEFLSDISSLLRIVVPYDVKIERATSPTMDSTGNTALLAVSFKIRTFIKTVAPVSGAEAAPPVPQPAPAPAPAAGAPPAQPPRAGGGGE